LPCLSLLVAGFSKLRSQFDPRTILVGFEVDLTALELVSNSYNKREYDDKKLTTKSRTK
jgi:hypothetical protein